MATIRKRTIRWTTKNGAERTKERWRARYVDDAGQRHDKDFDLRRDAQDWLDEQTAKLVAGTHIAPRKAKTTVAEWCDTWLAGYRTRRPGTVRAAETHLKQIRGEFGRYQLAAVRPSQVKAWCARLKADGYEASYVYALHSRLAQLYYDAINDGLVVRSPCSRKTAPPAGKQKPYVATTEQVWALYDTMPENLRTAVLLGAFLGARDAEACGLVVPDLDLMRGIWQPTAQYPAMPLKTECSKWPVSFGRTLSLEIAAHIETLPVDQATGERDGEWLLRNQWGDQLHPRVLQRAIRDARAKVPGLPETFGFHDLRHYFASMLIEDGADVKKVQAALRHASAKTTLDTYSHLWPGSEESIRAAGEKVMRARVNAREDAEKRPSGTGPEGR